MSVEKTQQDSGHAFRERALKMIALTNEMLAPFRAFIASLAKHAHTSFIQKQNRPNRRFFVGVRRHHAKHLDASDYIALLITGGCTTSH